jgi:hypothetical protein
MYDLARMRDPLGVVRDGDTILITKPTSYTEQFKMALKRVNEGDILPPESLREIAQSAEIRARHARRAVRETIEERSAILRATDATQEEIEAILSVPKRLLEGGEPKDRGGAAGLPPGIPEGSKRLPVMTKSGKRAWQAPDGSLWEED